MGALVRLEMRRALGGRCFAAALGIGTTLGLLAAIEPVQRYLVYVLPHQTDPAYMAARYTQQFSVNAYTSWAPMNMYHAVPNLMFLLMPVLIAFAWSWSVRADVESGYAQALLTRSTRGRCYAAKACAAFLAGGIVAAVPLVANLLAVACFIPFQTPSILDQTYHGIFPATTFSGLFFSHPALYVLARTGIDFALGGLWAMAVLGLSLLLRNKVSVVVMPFIAVVVVKAVMDGAYDLAGQISDCWTIIDHLKASSDSGYYTGWMLLADALALLTASIALPFTTRRRDVL